MRSNPDPLSALSEVLLAPERWNVIYSGVAPEERRWAVRHPAGAASGAAPTEARSLWSTRHAHCNSHRELLLTVRGNDWFGMGGILYPCRPGTLFVIDAAVPHDYYYPPTATGLEHIWMRTLGARVIVTWRRIEKGRTTRLFEPLTVLKQEQIGVHLTSFPDPTQPLASEEDRVRVRLLAGLTAAYLHAHKDSESPPPALGRSAEIQQDVVKAICHHIDETAGKGVTLEFLSHFSGYSKYHLHRFFRAHAGCTIHQYIDASRLRHMHFLSQKGASNTNISDALGFSDTASFLRWRRRKCGGDFVSTEAARRRRGKS